MAAHALSLKEISKKIAGTVSIITQIHDYNGRAHKPSVYKLRCKLLPDLRGLPRVHYKKCLVSQSPAFGRIKTLAGFYTIGICFRRFATPGLGDAVLVLRWPGSDLYFWNNIFRYSSWLLLWHISVFYKRQAHTVQHKNTAATELIISCVSIYIS